MIQVQTHHFVAQKKVGKQRARDGEPGENIGVDDGVCYEDKKNQKGRKMRETEFPPFPQMFSRSLPCVSVTADVASE